MSGQDSYRLNYRILYGHCVPASDVIKMIALLRRANNLTDTVIWNKGDGQPSLSIPKAQFIEHLLGTFETSLKAFEKDDDYLQGTKGKKDSGSLFKKQEHL